MKNTRICISGANSQIGSYLAKAYAAAGHPLILLYHKREERITGLDAPRFALDLLDYRAVQELLQSQPEEIDVLIHCAAVRSSDARPLADTDPQTFHAVFDANFYPAYNLLRAILPGMREQGFGRVVLFASDITRKGLPNGSAYAAAKAAIANMARSASLEMAGNNVLINCISPGPVDTDLSEDFSGQYLEFRKAYFARHIQKCASQALVTKQEIKAAVDLLISAEMRNMCGEEIFMNGGNR